MFEEAVDVAASSVSQTEDTILNEQGRRTLEEARVDHLDSLTGDNKKLTELKESYAGAVMFFLWYWFGALILVTLTYFTYQMNIGKEIPKEVMIAIFSTTAIVVGLVGYILKGLFGSK